MRLRNFGQAALRIFWGVVLCLSSMQDLRPAMAQGFAPSDPFSGRQIEAVQIQLINPGADESINERVTGNVRRLLGLLPGDSFSPDRIGFALAQAARAGDVAKLDYEVQPGVRGGVEVVVSVTLAPQAEAGQPRGELVTGSGFPRLYDSGDLLLNADISALSLWYANNNAWFGRPDLMVAGNPLVTGTPAGRGFDQWLEGYVEFGVNGMARLSANAWAYGAVSNMVTTSVGQELFSSEPRLHNGIEKAYAGIVVGKTTSRGDRIAFNLSAGRQRFTLANAFLIANTASNGGERGGLQANARWAADLVVNGQLVYNNLKLEAFLVDPDELPVLDTQTRIHGANLEYRAAPGLMLAGSWLTVPRSTFSYFAPTGLVGTREGLRLWDARFTWSPAPPGRAGPFFGGEYARQSNSNFPMRATAGYAEVGYTSPKLRWSPTLSYRWATFSGDDPDTSRYERWDGLLSGGSGEQWVQGANLVKVVQNGNNVAHRVQLRLMPAPRWELISQYWDIDFASTVNVGGNPALQFVSSKDIGNEVVVVVKHYPNRHFFLYGQVAFTSPRQAIRDALRDTERGWASATFFLRYSF